MELFVPFFFRIYLFVSTRSSIKPCFSSVHQVKKRTNCLKTYQVLTQRVVYRVSFEPGKWLWCHRKGSIQLSPLHSPWKNRYGDLHSMLSYHYRLHLHRFHSPSLAPKISFALLLYTIYLTITIGRSHRQFVYYYYEYYLCFWANTYVIESNSFQKNT